MQTNRPPKPILYDQFGLFMDHDQVVRCRGRLNNSTLPLGTKNPILLPHSHCYIKLLISDFHVRMKHGGVNDTLAAIREEFWILKGRQAVKQIVRHCITCKRMDGHPYPPVSAPDLPTVRVSDDAPFTSTGVDFAGPLYVSQPTESSKVYVCLFTCASTRAIHLELVPNLNTGSFLLAFCRFVGRRGLPTILLSDNAKTFKSSSKEIRNIVGSREISSYLTSCRVTWKFIVERAPWWGGFWERMVQLVKRSLRKAIGRTTLTFDQLNTVLIEVESIVNSRPLTYIYDDVEGVSYPISPSHLVYGRRITNRPNDETFEVSSTHDTLVRRSKQQRRTLSRFLSIWRKMYLTNLREYHRVKGPLTREGPSKSVGDVVILKNDSTKRLFWKLAIVRELLTGNDGKVRAAMIKVTDDLNKTRLLRRSTQHLIPIEVKDKDRSLQPVEEVEESQPSCSTSADNDAASTENVVNTGRPRRQAAVVGELNRRINKTY